MKPENLKLALDKIVATVTEWRFHPELRKDIKTLVEYALEGMIKEVEMYGTNTHSATAAQAYLINFRRIV